MAAICDTYDALVSARPHRPARGPADAVAEMYKLKGQFDESLPTSFIKSIGIYPVGSLVRREPRSTGCVEAQPRNQHPKPVLRRCHPLVPRDQVPGPVTSPTEVHEKDRTD